MVQRIPGFAKPRPQNADTGTAPAVKWFNPISDWAVQPLVNLDHKNYSGIKPCAVSFMVDEWSCRNLLQELISGFYVARAAGASTVSMACPSFLLPL